MSKTSLQGGRAEEHEFLCNGTILNWFLRSAAAASALLHINIIILGAEAAAAAEG